MDNAETSGRGPAAAAVQQEDDQQRDRHGNEDRTDAAEGVGEKQEHAVASRGGKALAVGHVISMEPPLIPLRSKFETVMPVRPDDIDMNQHVHNSKYFDYVLAARYDQMARCYRMPMEEFIANGFGWVVKTAHVNYKRPLGLGDVMVVRTWIEAIAKDSVTVQFQILREKTGKLCADGYFDYTMISLGTGRGEAIPGWIAEKYAV